MPSKSLYFSYGSNMLHERLQKRCPSAEPIGIASVRGYKLVFHKRSADGSGKATLVKSGDAQSLIHGMVFELEIGDKQKLDLIEGEGFGYHCINDFELFMVDSSKKLYVDTYFATSDYIDEKLKPYYWYKSLVIAGAKQNNLPKEYIKKLDAIKITNVLPENKKKAERGLSGQKEALEILEKAGFSVEKEKLLVC